MGSVIDLSNLCPGCGLGIYLVGFPVGICWFCIGLMAPFPMLIGEVLSIPWFSLGLWLLVFFWLCMGHCPFGNKFLIIQKK